MDTPQVMIARRQGRTRVIVDLPDADVTSLDALWRAAVAIHDEATVRETETRQATSALEQRLGVA